MVWDDDQAELTPILYQGILIERRLGGVKKHYRNALLCNPKTTQDIKFIHEALLKLDKVKHLAPSNTNSVEVLGHISYAAMSGSPVLIVGTNERIFIPLTSVKAIKDEEEVGSACQIALKTGLAEFRYGVRTSKEYQRWIEALQHAFQYAKSLPPWASESKPSEQEALSAKRSKSVSRLAFTERKDSPRPGSALDSRVLPPIPSTSATSLELQTTLPSTSTTSLELGATSSSSPKGILVRDQLETTFPTLSMTESTMSRVRFSEARATNLAEETILEDHSGSDSRSDSRTSTPPTLAAFNPEPPAAAPLPSAAVGKARDSDGYVSQTLPQQQPQQQQERQERQQERQQEQKGQKPWPSDVVNNPVLQSDISALQAKVAEIVQPEERGRSPRKFSLAAFRERSRSRGPFRVF
ncbi:uncharacterized protein BJ171DRAFT_616833 [Polychytrium aggregatum]|uniref:uncharacterized protein n=1 Tax=Polychytrium aggregatum TaxID=110093 RepID=UPI0022FDB985|nr:uncharacterized protein BJ171DRAFT_616833 [Polychytrium aggregatum]KAI9204977.1 hypothetical protein BJ171DRAFT_616833 [Polychytrium aggregatum]